MSCFSQGSANGSGREKDGMKRASAPIPKKKIDPRESLMDAVVRLTASGGIESVSVRTVVAEASGVSTDLYLYRLFGGKEQLLSDAFLREDRRLSEEVFWRSDSLFESNLPFESRLRYLWNGVWSWLISHPGECLFLARYFYSSYPTPQIWERHRAVWASTAEKWQDVFPLADTARLTDTFFSSLLSAAFPVCLGRIPDDGTAVENGFLTLSGVFAFWAGQEQKNA